MKKKVFYFLPDMDVGGVQVALSRALPQLRQEFDLSVFFVKKPGSMDVGQKPWWAAFACFFELRLPRCVVTSLWMSLFFGLFFKLLGAKWVAFVHSARFHHRRDAFFHKLLLGWADVVAVDSQATAAFVWSFMPPSTRVELVPFKFPRVRDPAQGEVPVKKLRSFVCVGRNDPVKRFDLLATYADRILGKWQDAHFWFVVSGEPLPILQNLELKYLGRAHVLYNVPHQQVQDVLDKSHFYVILSDFEGFSMSTYEAVQANCFVIYRDVGEISSYVLPTLSCSVSGPDYTTPELEAVIARGRVPEVAPQGFAAVKGYVDSLTRLIMW